MENAAIVNIHMALIPETFYLLIVITIFIIINVIVFYVSRIKVNLTIKQRISVDDEPVIQIQSGEIRRFLSVYLHNWKSKIYKDEQNVIGPHRCPYFDKKKQKYD